MVRSLITLQVGDCLNYHFPYWSKILVQGSQVYNQPTWIILNIMGILLNCITFSSSLVQFMQVVVIPWMISYTLNYMGIYEGIKLLVRLQRMLDIVFMSIVMNLGIYMLGLYMIFGENVQICAQVSQSYIGMELAKMPLVGEFIMLLIKGGVNKQVQAEGVKTINDVYNAIKPDILWCDQSRTYYLWKGTKWQSLEQFEAQRYIYTILANYNIKPSLKKVNQVQEEVRMFNFVPKMGNNSSNLQFFEDVVWDIESKIWIEHDRVHLNTYNLPYNAKEFVTEGLTLDDFPNISNWFDTICGDDELKRELLQGYLHQLLIGKNDHQVFQELVGPGGSGKSTYSNLAMALVGFENVHSSNQGMIQSNRFELANLQGKRLVVMPDHPVWAGSVDTLKAMTGQDPLRYEVKGIQGGQPFIFEGLVIITANQPFVSTDVSSGLTRRRQLVSFVNKDASIKGDQLKLDSKSGLFVGTFVEELPTFINYLLQMSPSAIDNQFSNAVSYFSSVQSNSAEEVSYSGNSVESFIKNCIDYMDGSVLPLNLHNAGEINYKGRDDILFESPSIYGYYKEHCVSMGFKPIGVTRFGAVFKETLARQTDWFDDGVTYARTRTHVYWTNLGQMRYMDSGHTYWGTYTSTDFRAANFKFIFRDPDEPIIPEESDYTDYESDPEPEDDSIEVASILQSLRKKPFY